MYGCMGRSVIPETGSLRVRIATASDSQSEACKWVTYDLELQFFVLLWQVLRQRRARAARKGSANTTAQEEEVSSAIKIYLYKYSI